MKSLLKWAAVVLLGMALGIGFAVWQIRNSGLGNDIAIGPWTTGRDVGPVDAERKTRAVVGLRALLALPKREARYFTAATDSAGQPLSGKCSYVLEGGAIDARWWSVTLYDRGGWLIPNRWNRYSIGSARIPADQAADWTVVIAPDEEPGLWIPTATSGLFELTLCACRPHGGLASDPGQATMPTITKRECKP